MRSIVDYFTCEADCSYCGGIGIICEDHPKFAWDEWHQDHCGPGMPCVNNALSKRMD